MTKLYKLTDANFQSILAGGAYCKTYEPGTIVEADPTTLGLMLFENYNDIINYYHIIRILRNVSKPFRILKVKGIGNKTIPINVSGITAHIYIHRFYQGYNVLTIDPPHGTVCYNKINVLYQQGPALGIYS